MITYKKFSRNFQEVQDCVSDLMPNDIRDLLDGGVSDSVKEIILEYPYNDKDFRDTYYNDFCKRFADISRDSVRLHFFYEEGIITSPNYGGFITLRDTKLYTIGRSYLHPKVLKHFSSGFFCLTKFKVQFQGIELEVEAFPWMQQDGNVSRCAHIAVWAANRYFSQKFTYYPEKTLHEISSHDSITKRIPSKGATCEQIAQMLQRSRFDPEIYIRDSGGAEGEKEVYYSDHDFSRLIYTFIESGIPYIAGLREKRHAVAVLGHGEISAIDREIRRRTGIVDSCELIEDIILSDDNVLPYTRAYNYENKSFHKLEDIDVVIVPFYQKMYLDVDWLYGSLLSSIEKNLLDIEDDTPPLIRRALLTSSNSLKKFINTEAKDPVYKEIILHSQMPKFVWIAEYSTIDEYERDEISIRVILDATMLSFQVESFISIKKGNELFIKPKALADKGFYVKQLSEKVDKLYVNNLRRVS